MRKFRGVPVCADAGWRADTVCTEEGLRSEGEQRVEEEDMEDDDEFLVVVAGVEVSGSVVDGA